MFVLFTKCPITSSCFPIFSFLLFIIEVINKSDLSPLLSFGHDNVTAVPTLAGALPGLRGNVRHQ